MPKGRQGEHTWLGSRSALRRAVRAGWGRSRACVNATPERYEQASRMFGRFGEWTRPYRLVVRRRTPARSSNLCHRDDLSRRVEATSDPRLSNFDAAALSCIVYAHLDRCGEGTATVPAQGTCAGCVHTHGTKRLRS